MDPFFSNFLMTVPKDTKCSFGNYEAIILNANLLNHHHLSLPFHLLFSLPKSYFCTHLFI